VNVSPDQLQRLGKARLRLVKSRVVVCEAVTT